jgi:hypothetical protein
MGYPDQIDQKDPNNSTNSRTSEQKSLEILLYIKNERIGDVKIEEGNAIVTVSSRRVDSQRQDNSSSSFTRLYVTTSPKNTQLKCSKNLPIIKRRTKPLRGGPCYANLCLTIPLVMLFIYQNI